MGKPRRRSAASSAATAPAVDASAGRQTPFLGGGRGLAVARVLNAFRRRVARGARMHVRRALEEGGRPKMRISGSPTANTYSYMAARQCREQWYVCSIVRVCSVLEALGPSGHVWLSCLQ